MIAVAICMLAETARADETGRVFLDWRSSESCASREAVAKDVEETLHREVFTDESSADRTLHVGIGHDGDVYRGNLSFETRRGEPLGTREVRAHDCHDFASATALAISIMADLPKTRAEVQEQEEEEKHAPPPPPPAARPRPPPQEAPPSPPQWHSMAWLGPTLAVDSNGDAEGGGVLTAIFVPPHFVPFSATLLMSPRVSETPEGMGFVLLRTTVAASLCLPPWTRGRFTGLACLGPDLDVHVGWGDGFTNSHAGLSSTVGGLFQSLAMYEITPRLRVVGGVLASATPQSVSLSFTNHANASQQFYETPHFWVGGTVGVLLDLF